MGSANGNSLRPASVMTYRPTLTSRLGHRRRIWHRLRAYVFAVLAFGASGCSSWSQAALGETSPTPAHDVQIWRGDSASVVYAADVRGDSVVGFGDKAHRTTLAFASSETDSVRVKKLDVTKTFLAAVGVGAAAISVLWLIIPTDNFSF